MSEIEWIFSTKKSEINDLIPKTGSLCVYRTRLFAVRWRLLCGSHRTTRSSQPSRGNVQVCTSTLLNSKYSGPRNSQPFFTLFRLFEMTNYTSKFGIPAVLTLLSSLIQGFLCTYALNYVKNDTFWAVQRSLFIRGIILSTTHELRGPPELKHLVLQVSLPWQGC